MACKKLGGDTKRSSPTHNEFAKLEKLIGAHLPSSFVEFLTFSNGGYPLFNAYYLNDIEYEINNFFHLSTEFETDSENIFWQYKHRWADAKREFLPIARDLVGNIYYLDLTEVDTSRVLLWIHDDPDRPIRVLSNSFEEFIDSLKLTSDE